MALTTIKLAAMSANSVDSDQYVDGSIETVHLADDAVDSDEIAAGAIDAAHMSANSIDSDQYVDGSIDTAHIADNQVNGDKLTDNIDIAGTLDVTGVATFDSTSTFTGAATFSGNIDLTDSTVDLYSQTSTTSSKTFQLFSDIGGTKVEKVSITADGAATFSGSITDSKGNVRNIPASTNSTLVAADAGKHISITAGITINASTDFAIGDAVTIFNNQAAGNDETITATGIDLYLATDPSVSGATNRTLAPRGVVTILCVAADKYVITGAGLS